MLLKYIGKYSGAGIQNGYVYPGSVWKTKNFIWLECRDDNGRTMRTAYETIDDLNKDWRAIRYESI